MLLVCHGHLVVHRLIEMEGKKVKERKEMKERRDGREERSKQRRKGGDQIQVPRGYY